MLLENMGREARTCFGVNIEHSRGTGPARSFSASSSNLAVATTSPVNPASRSRASTARFVLRFGSVSKASLSVYEAFTRLQKSASAGSPSNTLRPSAH